MEFVSALTWLPCNSARNVFYTTVVLILLRENLFECQPNQQLHVFHIFFKSIVNIFSFFFCRWFIKRIIEIIDIDRIRKKKLRWSKIFFLVVSAENPCDKFFSEIDETYAEFGSNRLVDFEWFLVNCFSPRVFGGGCRVNYKSLRHILFLFLQNCRENFTFRHCLVKIKVDLHDSHHFNEWEDDFHCIDLIYHVHYTK